MDTIKENISCLCFFIDKTLLSLLRLTLCYFIYIKKGEDMFKILSICLSLLLLNQPVVAQSLLEGNTEGELGMQEEACPEERMCEGRCCQEDECCNMNGFCCKECPERGDCERTGLCTQYNSRGCASCVKCD